MGKNLCKKYGITEEQLKKGIDIVAKNLTQICNIQVCLAVCELLANGDIQEDKGE